MTSHNRDIVDYYDNRRISCGVVLEQDDKRLRVLNERGQEAKISLNRVLNRGRDPSFPSTGSRDELVERLQELSDTRERIKDEIDLAELWEVVGEEASEMCVDELSDLLFGSKRDVNTDSGLLRAIAQDKFYFRLKADRVRVHSPDWVENALRQQAKEEARERFIQDSAQFLFRVSSGEKVGVEEAPEGLVAKLEEAALNGNDWAADTAVRDIFRHAGLERSGRPFDILVSLGVWSEDENVLLKSLGVPVEFSPEALSEAERISTRPLPVGTQDLTATSTVAIDSESTRDVDDALSIERDGQDYIVGIHITDVAHFVDHDSLLDREIRERAVSIYLPEQLIPMIPPVLSEGASSLCVGKMNPALSVTARVKPDGDIGDYRIFHSTIRLTERLSYEDADRRIADGSTAEADLHRAALSLRNRRIHAGAVIFRDPELSVRVDDTGTIDVSVRNRETPSQILVSEMMICANNLFARFLRQHGTPAIYRSQPAPSEKIRLGEEYDPVESYQAKRAMARGDMGLEPAPHYTLGLDCYTTATSPLRRYPDLLIQRQIKSVLTTGIPLLDRDDVERIKSEISPALDAAGAVERDRRRYFLLKYLRSKRKEQLEAVVLQRFPRFHLVQLTDFVLNAPLTSDGNLSLNPGDRVAVRINKLDPRSDKLNLSLAGIL